METCYIYFANHCMPKAGGGIWKKNEYFERHPESERKRKDYTMIKIGETTNIKNRKQTLARKESIHIRKYVQFEGTKTDRLFVESYVRKKIEKHFPFNCSLWETDHFYCMNTNVIWYIQQHFEEWANEGIKALHSFG